MINTAKISEDIAIEVYVDDNAPVEISSFSKKIDPFGKLSAFLEGAVTPLIESYEKAAEKFNIEEAKIGFGIKVGAEGNLILSKTNLEANIQIEFLIKNKKAKL